MRLLSYNYDVQQVLDIREKISICDINKGQQFEFLTGKSLPELAIKRLEVSTPTSCPFSSFNWQITILNFRLSKEMFIIMDV